MESSISRPGLDLGLLFLVWVFYCAKSVLAGTEFESCSPHPSAGIATKWRLQNMNMNRRWRSDTTDDAMMVPDFSYTRTTTLRTLASMTNMATHHHGFGNITGAKVKCTSQYWSEGKETWPRMLPIVSMVVKVLGSGALEAYGHPQLTVLDAMRMEERDSYISLLKQSSTTLVNAYRREGFPYPPWRVKTLFIQSLVSQQATAAQAFDLPTRHVHNQPGIYKTERGTTIFVCMLLNSATFG